MARPISATHALKREAILDLAANCFAQSGYHATSMNDIAAALGTSKARLYHYHASKESILFELLDAYTQRLLVMVGETEAHAQRAALDERAALHELVRRFLAEYESSATRHAALLHDAKFLSPEQRTPIVQRQRDVVSAFTRFVRRAYPERVHAHNQTAVTMMLMGMMNWTFTWLKPGGAMSYLQFAQHVIELLEQGLGHSKSAGA